MPELTTTSKTPTLANTQDWDACLVNDCRARELAKIAAKAAKARDIRRLGGVRAYEDFTAEKYADKAILAQMRNFPKENYYLWGTAGVGKTHAAVAVARKVSSAWVLRLSRISRWLRSIDDPLQEGRVMRQLAEMTLVLDDLGAEKMTDFLQNALFEVLDRRWQNKQGGLIITANMDVAKLGAIVGDRTASRIVGLVGAQNILEVRGKDWRLQ